MRNENQIYMFGLLKLKLCPFVFQSRLIAHYCAPGLLTAFPETVKNRGNETQTEKT